MRSRAPHKHVTGNFKPKSLVDIDKHKLHTEVAACHCTFHSFLFVSPFSSSFLHETVTRTFKTSTPKSHDCHDKPSIKSIANNSSHGCNSPEETAASTATTLTTVQCHRNSDQYKCCHEFANCSKCKCLTIR